MITVPTDSSDEGITVDIPDSVRDDLPDDTSLNIVIVGAMPTSDEISFGSSAVDLTLTNSQGQQVKFAGQIELCFDVEASESKSGEACLGYLDEECGEWVCEDKSLKNKSGKLCGSTGHFTSFAILIGANLNSGCGKGATVDRVVVWLSAALAILAIVIFFLCAIIKEVRMRLRKSRIECQFGRSDRVWTIQQSGDL